MKTLIKHAVQRWDPRLVTDYRAYKSLIKDRSSFLHTTGWMQSLEHGHPCRADGSEVPWMNYGVIAFLEGRLKPAMQLFEYGSGFSTAFYAKLVGSVTSLEYDAAWFEIVRQKVPSNVRLVFQDQDVDGAYCRAILAAEVPAFDVVVVDGRDRVNCVKQALSKLTADGVIVLDDSQRERYAEAFDDARSHGFKALDFEGLKPTGAGIDRTTVFYRSDNCLGL